MKIKKETLEKMQERRRQGMSHREISRELGISRWSCSRYLRGIEIDESVSSNLWKEAEEEAIVYLRNYAFDEIINLNKISPQSHFDVLAKKSGEWWLIDVTINESKDLVNKVLHVVDGFRCAVLYVSHDIQNFRLMELVEVDLSTPPRVQLPGRSIGRRPVKRKELKI